MPRRPKLPQSRPFAGPTKAPVAVQVPGDLRQPLRGVAEVNPNRLSPSWRIGRMEMVDPFGWHQLEAERLQEIRSRLAGFESMTWNEILVGSGKQNHAVSVGALCREARDRLESLKILEDEVISLRVTGERRVWGYRAELGSAKKHT